jgi:hypothetical protein
MEAAILRALNLPPSPQTRVLVLPRRLTKPWDSKKHLLYLPFHLAKAVPAHVSNCAIAAPSDATMAWDLFVVGATAVKAGKLGTSKVDESKLVRIPTPGPAVPGWAYLPWPRLTPPPGTDLVITTDTLNRLLARALQSTAEWLFLVFEGHNDPGVEARLLAQYATDEGALADTLFASLVLPYARGARAPCHKRLRATALGARSPKKTVVVDWEALSQATSLKHWLCAGWAQAAAFESLAPTDKVERLRREALDAHVAALKRLLPGPALAWVKESRAWSLGTQDDLLTQLTGEGPGGFARDYRRMRADIGRFAIVHGQHRAPPSGEGLAHWEQQRLLAAPFVGSWNAAQGGGGRKWAVLAHAAAQHSQLPLIQGKAVRAAVREQKEREQRRLAIALYYRDKGLWRVTHEDRAERLAGLDATANPRRLETLFLRHPYVPSCLKSVLARGRGDHHLYLPDRMILGPWLAALLPLNGDTEEPDAVRTLTQFALAMGAEDPPTETSEALAATITQAAKGREAAPAFATGYACKGVIKDTLDPEAGEDRCACRCPYAALRVPNLEVSGGWDIGPCARACGAAVKAAAKDDPKVPLNTWHPLDRLLWARETGLLEW